MSELNLKHRPGRVLSGARALCIAFIAVPASVERPAVAAAEDAWPQWGGPSRCFKVDGDLATKWPKEGPKELWRTELGDGYSSVISDGDMLYTMYSIRKQLAENKWEKEGQEAVVAVDARTGKKLWEHKYDVTWEEDMNMEFGPGPHSTPLVVGDRLFAVGCLCNLLCLDRKTGSVIWEKNLHKELEASHLQRGYGASPLAYKEWVILPIGGKGKGIVAFSQKDGSIIWQNQDSGPTYASPILINIDGENHLVTFADNGASGLNPEDGSLLWNAEHKTQYDANISTPVWCKDNILFISSAYGNGARGIQVKRDGDGWSAKELWYNPKMKIHHGTAVAQGDYVYGSSGDFGPAFLAAVDIHTGDFAWRQRGFTKANVLLCDGKLIVLDEDGRLAITKPSKKKCKVLSKAQVCKRIAWTVPTLVDGRLYVRDRHDLVAFDLGASKGAAVSAR